MHGALLELLGSDRSVGSVGAALASMFSIPTSFPPSRIDGLADAVECSETPRETRTRTSIQICETRRRGCSILHKPQVVRLVEDDSPDHHVQRDGLYPTFVKREMSHFAQRAA
jgi:hypothetical protein